MLRQREYIITSENGENLRSAAGSVIHGAIMEALPTDIATRWHQNAVRPYSQGLYFDKRNQTVVWRISTLTDEAEENIQAVLEKWAGNFYLRQKQLTVHISPRGEICDTFEGLADRSFGGDNTSQGGELSFLTTTGFKREGRYLIFPELYLIYQSLLSKWNAFSDRESLQSPDLARELAELSHVTGYSLRSQLFPMEGQKIYGFGGAMRLKFSGSDMAKRICCLLLDFAPFTGIGIKTALGMGLCDTKTWQFGGEKQ